MDINESLPARWSREAQSWQNPSWVKMLVVLPWALLVIYSLYQWRLDRKIAARQLTTYGTVVAHEPAHHDRYSFAFMLNGRTYQGWEYPQNKQYRVGEQVVVYYDPINPARSALTEFGELSLREFGLVPLTMLGIGSGGVFHLQTAQEVRTFKLRTLLRFMRNSVSPSPHGLHQFRSGCIRR